MQEQEFREIFSQNIKKFRVREKLSQKTLAQKLNLSGNYISDIELCRKWISPKSVVKLAAALNVEPYELFKPEIPYTGNEMDILQSYAKENIDTILKIFKELSKSPAKP